MKTRTRFLQTCRRSILILFFLGIFVPDCPVYAAEETKEIPPMPEGYSSEMMLKLDYTLGRLTLIDTDHVPVPENVIEEKNLEYGKVGDRSLQLDLYRPKNASQPVPGLIFIHGGAWKSGKRDVMKYYAVRYAERGYAAVTISYRLTKEALYPAAVQDTKCAVRWMRANAQKYNIDPDHIGISGNSAGGHLSMMVGYSSDVPELEGEGGYMGVSSRVQAVVDFYGPTDLTTEFARKQDVVKNFLGKSYDEDPQIYKAASPITYLTPDDPPTLIFQGTIDSVVPPDQADILADKLKTLGIDYLYEKFTGWPHTMDMVETVNLRCQYRMNEFFAKHLQGK